MKITEHDWDLATTVTREYPEELFEAFINWFLNTRHWEYEIEYVIDRVQRLREELGHARVDIRERERIERDRKAAKDEAIKNLNDEAARLIEAAGV